MNPKEKLQAILDAANNTTSAADTDITEAVRSLIDGYGQGGITGKVVSIVGEGYIDVSDVGDYGLAVRISPPIRSLTTVVFAFAWNQKLSFVDSRYPEGYNGMMAFFADPNGGNAGSQVLHGYYPSYSKTEKKIFVPNSRIEQVSGDWLFIPYYTSVGG